MLNQSVLKKSLLAVAGLLVCAAASAAMDEESSAPAYRFGGVTAYPGLGLALKNDSNIFRLADTDPNKKSSMITVLSPSVVLQAGKDANAYSLAYLIDIGRYSNSSADNYTDQKLLGQAEFGLSSRSTLKIVPEYLAGHDDRGSTFGAVTAEPNKWHSAGLNGSFAYGAEESRSSVVLDLGYSDRTYQNNRTLTTAYDKTLTGVGGTFYFRVQPKTSLLLHAKRTGIAYKQTGSLLNGNEQRFMLGVKWEATAQTVGEVKVGQLQKKFDSTLPTHSGASWEGAVRWSPLTFVKVDLVSSKQPNETTLAGSSTILVSNTGANVAYDLNDRVTLHASGYQVKEDFVGANRNDSTNNFGLKAEYKFRSWLVGGAEYTSSAKTSNNPLNDYKRNIFLLSVRSVL